MYLPVYIHAACNRMLQIENAALITHTEIMCHWRQRNGMVQKHIFNASSLAKPRSIHACVCENPSSWRELVVLLLFEVPSRIFGLKPEIGKSIDRVNILRCFIRVLSDTQSTPAIHRERGFDTAREEKSTRLPHQPESIVHRQSNKIEWAAASKNY